MTSQERKQKVIREAYGKKWDNAKEKVDENGWGLGVRDFIGFGNYSTKVFGAGVLKYRPKSLDGIEINNGWTAVDEYGDLPAHLMQHKYDICWMKEDGNVYDYAVDALAVHAAWASDKITHYRVHNEVGPIY